MNVTFGGKSVTLEGEQIKVGDTAPDFTALDTTLKPVKLSYFG
jgi:thiol peroxidase